MIIVVGGIKGGSGKSTVATNLAVVRASEGRDVLLIDADDQETSTDFTVLRNEQAPGGAGYTSIKLTGAAVRNETLRLAGKYEDIVIDTGGRDTSSQRASLTVAGMLLVPFVPRSFDLWTLDKVSELVAEIRTVNPALRAYVFLSRADPRGQDNSGAAEILKENETLTFIDTPLVSRKAFGNAASCGLAVTKLVPHDDKATEEFLVLFRYVFGIHPVSHELAAVGA